MYVCEIINAKHQKSSLEFQKCNVHNFEGPSSSKVVKLVSKWLEIGSIKLTLSINQICIVVKNKEQKRVKS